VNPLCQRGQASCGACCGLYNRRDHSRRAVAGLLDRRTEALAGAPRTREGFAAAGVRLSAKGDGEPLFPSVRICPLLGWLDAGRTRIGCLAHPAATGGEDLRDAGAYDRFTCEAFLCPSHAWLSEREAAMVADLCAGDPYLYGLTVTDVPFVQAALSGVAALCGARVEERHLGAARFREALRALLALKEELEPGSDGLYGAFRPGRQGEEVPRDIDYGAIGRPRSPYDEILRCAGADPRSGNDLDRLEDEVRRRLDACLVAFPG
jgi:hypothetical protein